MPKVGS